MLKVCRNCGRTFKSFPCAKRIYCSRKCYDEYRRKHGAWNRGKPWSEEVKKKISEIRKLQYRLGYVSPLKGKKRPDLAILNKKRAKWSAQKLRPILEDFANSPYALRDYVVRKKIGMNAQNLGGLFRKYLPEEYALVAERKKCRNKSYRKGRHFEWRVRDDFRAKGYFVLRSPRSAGPVDLVAIKKGDVVLIQCKVHYKTFKAKERKELGELAESIGARAIFAYRNSIDWSIRYETVFLPILITPMRNP